MLPAWLQRKLHKNYAIPVVVLLVVSSLVVDLYRKNRNRGA